MAKSGLYWVAGGLALLLILRGKGANAAPLSAANSISDSQLQQTADFEVFSPTAYPDGSNGTVQLYSIGYGHQIHSNETYLLTSSISTDQAKQFLATDMQNTIDIINNSGASFTQGQFDALSDFGFNEGPGALNKIIDVFNNNGAGAVPAAMQQYIYWHPVPGGPAQISQNLVTRRNANVDTWNS